MAEPRRRGGAFRGQIGDGGEFHASDGVRGVGGSDRAVHWTVHRERCRSAGSSRHHQRHGGRDYLVAAERHGDHRRDGPLDVRRGDLAAQRPRDQRRTGPATRSRRSGPARRRSTTRSPRRASTRSSATSTPATMTGTVTVEDAGADPLENVLVFSETAGFRHDSIPTRASPRSRRSGQPTTSRSPRPRTRRSSTPPTSPSTTPSSSSPRPATSSPTPSRTRSRTTCAPAAASSASMPRPTPSTRGPGTARCSAATSATTRAGTPTATVNIEDADEPSTRGPSGRLGADGRVVQLPVAGEPGASTAAGDDYSPRDSGVKVLATVDESTYDEDDGNDGTDDDHPIAWCSDFDGGHVWYTGMGHTAESFGTGEGNIRQHILGGLQTVTGAEPSDCGEPRQAAPDGRRLRDRHDRRRHREPDGARRRRRRPRLLRRAHHRRAERLQPGQRPGHDRDPDPGLQRAGERR